jgi:hypothetical protein
MPLKARNLVLTESQAACLVALQHRKGSKTEIAILAKPSLLARRDPLANLIVAPT